ncbi:MAG TPA: hypothetical protein VMN78_10815 [Longimicrobiales bacterium]|nr:hypothetical protein [Longimicrobiales bacterium]
MTRTAGPPAAPRADGRDAIRRVARVITDVVAAAARDARRERLVVLDAGTPEAGLLVRCLTEGGIGLPVERIRSAVGGPASIDGLRARARAAAGVDGLLLDPVNKTVAVLWPETVAEPVLPLADLYASQVAALADGWSAPADAFDLIARAGGIGPVDAFLMEHLDRRRPVEEALRLIPDPDAGAELRDRLAAGWWWRRRLGLVPKLGGRTLGLDLR